MALPISTAATRVQSSWRGYRTRKRLCMSVKDEFDAVVKAIDGDDKMVLYPGSRMRFCAVPPGPVRFDQIEEVIRSRRAAENQKLASPVPSVHGSSEFIAGELREFLQSQRALLPESTLGHSSSSSISASRPLSSPHRQRLELEMELMLAKEALRVRKKFLQSLKS